MQPPVLPDHPPPSLPPSISLFPRLPILPGFFFFKFNSTPYSTHFITHRCKNHAYLGLRNVWFLLKTRRLPQTALTLSVRYVPRSKHESAERGLQVVTFEQLTHDEETQQKVVSLALSQTNHKRANCLHTCCLHSFTCITLSYIASCHDTCSLTVERLTNMVI